MPGLRAHARPALAAAKAAFNRRENAAGRHRPSLTCGVPCQRAHSTIAAAMSAHPGVKIHTYGKDPRPARKVGHVNACGDELDAVAYEARAAAAFFAD